MHIEKNAHIYIYTQKKAQRGAVLDVLSLEQRGWFIKKRHKESQIDEIVCKVYIEDVHMEVTAGLNIRVECENEEYYGRIKSRRICRFNNSESYTELEFTQSNGSGALNMQQLPTPPEAQPVAFRVQKPQPKKP